MEQNNNVPEGIWIEELSLTIADDYEFSEAAAEIVDSYCERLREQEGMTIPIEEYDGAVEDHWTHLWSDKAQKLIESEINEWTMLGLQHWPDGDIDIHQFLMRYREL
jgi:hypothetical protein